MRRPHATHDPSVREDADPSPEDWGGGAVALHRAKNSFIGLTTAILPASGTRNGNSFSWNSASMDSTSGAIP